MTAAPLRLVVVDDHGLFRAGLIELLHSDPGVIVVGDGASGDAALALAAEHQPDVMLMDIEMPGPGAEATLTGVLEVSPHTAILVLTMHDDATMVRTLLRLGAAGYLIKSIEYHELLAAVRAAVRDQSTVTVSVSRATLGRLDHHKEPADVLLSPRELAVLGALAQACSNVQIGAQLFISQGTVKRHLTNLYAKLGATGRVDALLKARAAGLFVEDVSSGFMRITGQ